MILYQWVTIFCIGFLCNITQIEMMPITSKRTDLSTSRAEPIHTNGGVAASTAKKVTVVYKNHSIAVLNVEAPITAADVNTSSNTQAPTRDGVPSIPTIASNAMRPAASIKTGEIVAKLKAETTSYCKSTATNQTNIITTQQTPTTSPSSVLSTTLNEHNPTLNPVKVFTTNIQPPITPYQIYTSTFLPKLLDDVGTRRRVSSSSPVKQPKAIEQVTTLIPRVPTIVTEINFASTANLTSIRDFPMESFITIKPEPISSTEATSPHPTVSATLEGSNIINLPPKVSIEQKKEFSQHVTSNKLLTNFTIVELSTEISQPSISITKHPDKTKKQLSYLPTQQNATIIWPFTTMKLRAGEKTSTTYHQIQSKRFEVVNTTTKDEKCPSCNHEPAEQKGPICATSYQPCTTPELRMKTIRQGVPNAFRYQLYTTTEPAGSVIPKPVPDMVSTFTVTQQPFFKSVPMYTVTQEPNTTTLASTSSQFTGITNQSSALTEKTTQTALSSFLPGEPDTTSETCCNIITEQPVTSTQKYAMIPIWNATTTCTPAIISQYFTETTEPWIAIHHQLTTMVGPETTQIYSTSTQQSTAITLPSNTITLESTSSLGLLNGIKGSNPNEIVSQTPPPEPFYAYNIVEQPCTAAGSAATAFTPKRIETADHEITEQLIDVREYVTTLLSAATTRRPSATSDRSEPPSTYTHQTAVNREPLNISKANKITIERPNTAGSPLIFSFNFDTDSSQTRKLRGKLATPKVPSMKKKVLPLKKTAQHGFLKEIFSIKNESKKTTEKNIITSNLDIDKNGQPSTTARKLDTTSNQLTITQKTPLPTNKPSFTTRQLPKATEQLATMRTSNNYSLATTKKYPSSAEKKASGTELYTTINTYEQAKDTDSTTKQTTQRPTTIDCSEQLLALLLPSVNVKKDRNVTTQHATTTQRPTTLDHFEQILALLLPSTSVKNHPDSTTQHSGTTQRPTTIDRYEQILALLLPSTSVEKDPDTTTKQATTTQPPTTIDYYEQLLALLLASTSVEKDPDSITKLDTTTQLPTTIDYYEQLLALLLASTSVEKDPDSTTKQATTTQLPTTIDYYEQLLALLLASTSDTKGPNVTTKRATTTQLPTTIDLYEELRALLSSSAKIASEIPRYIARPVTTSSTPNPYYPWRMNGPCRIHNDKPRRPISLPRFVSGFKTNM